MLGHPKLANEPVQQDRCTPRVRMSDKQMDPLSKIISSSVMNSNALPMKKKNQ